MTSAVELRDQLEKAHMKIAKLTREKKKLQRQVDEYKQREAKLNTKLSWQRIQNKRDEREREIRNRRRLRDMQQMLKEESDHEATHEPFLPREMIDEELAEALDVVYSLEHNIQAQLEQINVDTIETENAKVYLDTSFETISLLIEQTRQQRSAIMSLRDQMRVMKRTNQELSDDLERIKSGESSGVPPGETTGTGGEAGGKEMSATPDDDVHMHDASASDFLSRYSDNSRLEDLEQQIADSDELIKRLEDMISQKDAEMERLKRTYEQKLENLDTQHKMDVLRVTQETRLEMEELKHARTNETRNLANEIKLRTREVELKEDEIRSLLTLQKTLQEQIHALKSQNQHLQYQIEEMKRKLERRERYIRNQDMKNRSGSSVVACHCWGN